MGDDDINEFVLNVDLDDFEVDLNADVEQLIDSTFDDPKIQETAREILHKRDKVGVPDELMRPDRDDCDNENLFEQIQNLEIPQKIKLALFGNKTARNALIRDKSSKRIPLFVLQNPRITDGELLEIVRNTNIDDAVLRVIGNNAEWMNSYAMKFAAVSNAKMPIDVSLKWIKFLQDKDLRRISRSKSISSVITSQARKALDKKQQAPS